MLPAAFEPLVKRAPFGVMARPTPESLFCPDRLDPLFERTARKQDTTERLSSPLVERMTAVVRQPPPAVRAADHHGGGSISASDPSVYNKLDGMAPGVSAALVHASAGRRAPVIGALKARQPPRPDGYRVRILDGTARFAFGLALLASNAVALIKAAVRAEQGPAAAAGRSAYNAALDGRQVHRGRMIALPAERWARSRVLGAAAFAAALRAMVRAIDLPRHRNSTRVAKTPPARKAYKKGGQVSTHNVVLSRKT